MPRTLVNRMRQVAARASVDDCSKDGSIWIIKTERVPIAANLGDSSMIAPPRVWFEYGRDHGRDHDGYMPPLSGGFTRILYYRVGWAIGRIEAVLCKGGRQA